MYVESENIINFRNIENEKLCFSKDINIFFGKNAQGKTNLAEAIYLILSGKSHRESKWQNFILFGKNNFFLEANIFNESENEKFKATVFYDNTSKITINSEETGNRKELSSYFKAVFFSSKDMDIVESSPKERRDFLDTAISFFSSQYPFILKEYKKVLKLKNLVLKKSNTDSSILDVYDVYIAKYSEYILSLREAFVKRLYTLLSNTYREIANDEGTLEVFYKTNCIKNTEKDIYNLIKENRKEEIFTKSAIIGIHNDDMEIVFNKKSAKTFCSRGQKKSIAICLKYDLAKIIEEKEKVKPIIILDDVMSELDNERQKKILTIFEQNQLFITATNYNFIEEINKNSKFFEIENGKVKKQFEREQLNEHKQQR